MPLCRLLVKVKWKWSCSVMSDSLRPVDCSPPGSSVHGILQARILEWVAIPSPGDLPDPGIEPRSPTLQADALTPAPPGKVTNGKFSSYVWVVFHFVCLYTTSSLSNHLCLEVLRRVILLLIVVLSCVLRIFFTCILVTLNRENLLFWAHWYCLISCENDSDTLPNTSTEGILSLLPLVEGNSFLTLSFWFFIS